MINLPSDSIPKLVTFIGLTIVVGAFYAQSQNIKRFQDSVQEIRMAQAEFVEINNQSIFHIERSANLLIESNAAYAEARELIESAKANEALIQIKIADARYSDSQISKSQGLAAAERGGLKSVEIARLNAASDYLSERVWFMHWSLAAGMIFGGIVFMFGLRNWAREDVKRGVQKPRRKSERR